MKLSLLLLMAAAYAAAADIPVGAHLLLRLQGSVNSRTAQPGDYVYMQTATPVAVDGNIVVPIGSYVQGVIAEVNRGGKMKGRADLSISLQSLTLASGKQYRFGGRLASVEGDAGGQRVIDRENTIQQGSTVGRDVATVAMLAGRGAVIGVFVGSFGNYRSGISAARVAKGAGIGAGVGATIGLVATSFIRGPDVNLVQGSTLDVVFDQAVPLE